MKLEQKIFFLISVSLIVEVAFILWLMHLSNVADIQVDQWSLTLSGNATKESAQSDLTGEEKRLQVANRVAANQARQRVRSFLFIDIALNVFIFLILAMFMSRMVTVRLASLQENASLLSARKPSKTPLAGGDEFEYLDQILHKIASDLNGAEQRKQELISIVKNDMRIPLTSLHNTLALFANGTYGALSERGVNRLAASEANALTLLDLINQILEVARIDAGAIELHKKVFAVAPVVAESIETIQVIAAQAGITVENHCPEKPIMIYGDELKLKQILTGLISTIIKNLEAGKKIAVVANQFDQFANVGVIDENLAIPTSYVKDSLDRSTRIETRIETSIGKYASVGLLLVMCKALVEAQGGQFTVESIDQKSNTFWLKLPQADTGNSAVM
ncbi:MAG TPA: HAMP domain-containing sensor histidine kinase [Drouetiella sp.]|jgi:signal transduction histidine kinase